IAVNPNDWSAKRRMLVSNIRCTTISNWITNIPAASKVIHCAAASEWARFISQKQEGGEQSQGSQDKSCAQQIRHAEQAKLGVGGFDEDDGHRNREKLEHQAQKRDRQRSRAQIGADADWKKDVY